MRKFGSIEMADEDYERVVKAYIRFYEDGSECSNRCPLGLESLNIWASKLYNRLFPKNICLGRNCFCRELPMFPSEMCPCYIMGEKAFAALEEFIKEYGKEFM